MNYKLSSIPARSVQEFKALSSAMLEERSIGAQPAESSEICANFGNLISNCISDSKNAENLLSFEKNLNLVSRAIETNNPLLQPIALTSDLPRVIGEFICISPDFLLPSVIQMCSDLLLIDSQDQLAPLFIPSLELIVRSALFGEPQLSRASVAVLCNLVPSKHQALSKLFDEHPLPEWTKLLEENSDVECKEICFLINNFRQFFAWQPIPSDLTSFLISFIKGCYPCDSIRILVELIRSFFFLEDQSYFNDFANRNGFEKLSDYLTDFRFEDSFSFIAQLLIDLTKGRCVEEKKVCLNGVSVGLLYELINKTRSPYFRTQCVILMRLSLKADPSQINDSAPHSSALSMLPMIENGPFSAKLPALQLLHKVLMLLGVEFAVELTQKGVQRILAETLEWDDKRILFESLKIVSGLIVKVIDSAYENQIKKCLVDSGILELLGRLSGDDDDRISYFSNMISARLLEKALGADEES